MDKKLELAKGLEKACKEAVDKFSWKEKISREKLEEELSKYFNNMFKPIVLCDYSEAKERITISVEITTN